MYRRLLCVRNISCCPEKFESEDYAVVEKIVFILILIIALGGGILGCIYEFGGRKSTPAEKAESEIKEGEEI